MHGDLLHEHLLQCKQSFNRSMCLAMRMHGHFSKGDGVFDTTCTKVSSIIEHASKLSLKRFRQSENATDRHPISICDLCKAIGKYEHLLSIN